jgi:hypothetical protein
MNTTTPITVTMTAPDIKHPWTAQEWDTHHQHAEVAAMRAFERECSQYNKVPSKTYTQMDMTQAYVALTEDFIDTMSIIMTKNEVNGEIMITKTYNLHRKWAVFAPRLADGKIFAAVGNSTSFFKTEAEATKFMKKIIKAAAEWQFQESLRQQYAEQARMVCRLDGNTAPHASTIDPNDPASIGAMVQIHQMGKFRTGIIVGQTPTKYVVVYTTPSNSAEIRSTKVSKGGQR